MRNQQITEPASGPTRLGNLAVQRRDILAPSLEKAIEHAGNLETAEVLLELRKIAVAKEAPFTGDIARDGALIYLDDDGNHATLSKDALYARLYRRKKMKP
jgi:hypothetical protein